MLRRDHQVSILVGLILGLFALPGVSDARFDLPDPDSSAFRSDRGRSAVVSFQPRLSYTVEPAPARGTGPDFLPLSVEGLDPEADWDLIAMAEGFTGGEEIPQTTGALIALPGRALGWSVEVTPASRAAAVTVSEATVGTVPSLHVIVDRSLAGAIGDQIDIRLNVESAAEPVIPRRSVAAGEDSVRIAQSIFLNGDTLPSVPLANASDGRSRSESSLPPPPGDMRITYKVGEGLLAVPLAQLGVGPTEAGILRLDHHGDTISVVSAFAGNALIYAPRRNTLTDRNDSLFATADPLNPSPVISTRPAFSTLTPAAGEIARERVRVYRERMTYERASTMPLRERFLFTRVQRGQTRSFQLPVNDFLTSPDVFMQLRILGLNTTPSVNPDHFADITLAGVELPRIEWDGRTQVQRSQNIPLSSLPNPPSLELVHTVPTVEIIPDLQNIRDVTLVWTGYPRIDIQGRGSVELPASDNPRLVTIGGFPEGTTAATLLVLDITSPKAPVRLTSPFTFTDASGTVAVQFEAPSTAGTYFAQRIDFGEAPQEVVAAEQLPDPSGAEEVLQAIYVREPMLAETLEPLVAIHDGAVIEIVPQQAYNAYNGGQQDPEAIRLAVRDYLELAAQREMLPTLVLVGDSTFDPRDYLGLITTPQVPLYVEASLESATNFEIESGVDYFYGLLFGDDLFEDVQIARLPVKTTDELSIIIDRVLAHRAIEDELSELARPGIFIGDNPRPNEFVDYRVDSAAVAGLFEDSGKPSQLIELAGSREPAFTEFKAAIEAPNGGACFVMYTGHGNITLWGDEEFVRANDIPNFETEGSWPLVTTFTCLNSYYAFPGQTTVPMGKRFITTPDGKGAIATITPAAAESYFPQLEFALRFVEEMRQPVGFRPATVGEAFTRARISYMKDLPSLGRTARAYHLFGEPTSNLTIPASVDYDFFRIY